MDLYPFAGIILLHLCADVIHGAGARSLQQRQTSQQGWQQSRKFLSILPTLSRHSSRRCKINCSYLCMFDSRGRGGSKKHREAMMSALCTDFEGSGWIILRRIRSLSSKMQRSKQRSDRKSDEAFVRCWTEDCSIDVGWNVRLVPDSHSLFVYFSF